VDESLVPALIFRPMSSHGVLHLGEPSATVSPDDRPRIAMVNRAFSHAFGWTLPALHALGLHVYEVLNHDNPEEIRKAVLQLLLLAPADKFPVIEYESKLMCADGSFRQVIARVIFIRGPSGVPATAIVWFRSGRLSSAVSSAPSSRPL